MNTIKLVNYQCIFQGDDKQLDRWNRLDMGTAGDMPLWHYGNAYYLVDNLTKKELSLGCLSTMDDGHEGNYPNRLTEPVFWDGYSRPSIVDEICNPHNNDRIFAPAHECKEHTFISCWSARKEEFEGFWRSFTDLTNGMAIKTTFGKLLDALTSSKKCEKVKAVISQNNLILRPIKYVNFQAMNQYKSWEELNFDDIHGNGNRFTNNTSDGMLAFGNTYFTSQFKRNSFFHERECRIIVVDTAKKINRTKYHHRVNIPFDWTSVIDEIWLAPKMPEWMRRYVRGELGHKYPRAEKSKVYQL